MYPKQLSAFVEFRLNLTDIFLWDIYLDYLFCFCRIKKTELIQCW